VLEIADVSFAYDGKDVLRDVSLTASGFVGVVGPNGSGKSTLVRVASRVLRPRSGRVTVDGAEPSARVLAVVPQETTIDFEFTCREIVAMGRFAHDDEDPRVIQESMERTGTWPLRDRLITELSGGERQRVILARAFAQQPKVLLLDEPTAHLDLRYQLELMKLVREAGMTVLAVMHDLNLASMFCTRLFLLHEGRIVASGTPAQVLTIENIQRTYGVEVGVQPHPRHGGPMIVA